MTLPPPPAAYDPQDQAKIRQAIAQADAQNRKEGDDLDLSRAGRLFLASSDGQRWEVTVSTSGALSAVKG